jgi:hypothetical protein
MITTNIDAKDEDGGEDRDICFLCVSSIQEPSMLPVSKLRKAIPFSSKVEATREPTSTATSTTTAASKATTSTHLPTKHLEQHFRVDLRTHTSTHAAAETTAAELFRRVDEVFAAVIAGALFRVRERFVGFANVLETICCCFVSLVLFLVVSLVKMKGVKGKTTNLVRVMNNSQLPVCLFDLVVICILLHT